MADTSLTSSNLLSQQSRDQDPSLPIAANNSFRRFCSGVNDRAPISVRASYREPSSDGRHFSFL
jgi:hypothetical protein